MKGKSFCCLFYRSIARNADGEGVKGIHNMTVIQNDLVGRMYTTGVVNGVGTDSGGR